MKKHPRIIPGSVLLLPSKKEVTPISPFFLTNELRRRIERLLPPLYHRRLSLYFKSFGCIACKRKDRMYVCNGLCRPCLKEISKKLIRVDRMLAKELKNYNDNRDEGFLLRFRSAREILSDLLPKRTGKISEKALVGRPAPRIYFK